MCNVYGKKIKTATPSKEVSIKGRDISNLQTGKDTNVMRKIYQSSRFYDNNAFWKLKKYTFSRFQMYARAYVHIKDATPC